MEEETTMIATSPESLNPAEDGSYYCQTWTHVEIHPAMILGKTPSPSLYMFSTATKKITTDERILKL
jgi:hypothetical protein